VVSVIENEPLPGRKYYANILLGSLWLADAG